MIPVAQSRSATIKAWAHEGGFDRVAIGPAVEATGFHRFVEWLDRGYAGEMNYLRNRKEAYRHPDSVLQGVRSLVILAMNYGTVAPPDAQPAAGRVSRYAWGTRDYHDVIHERLRWLLDRITTLLPTCTARGVVDTAPLLEREFAELAGLGWIGKHTLLLNRQIGSYFFLAAVLLDVELEYDPPGHKNYCGTCTACLDACPTQAFVAPYVLDATRCISYLTIEHRTAIPRELRESMGDWIFGCDVCQDVCPWNRDYPVSGETDFLPRDDLAPVRLPELFALTEAEFQHSSEGHRFGVPGGAGLLRNAAIALGNHPDEAGLSALQTALHDEEPLVREAAAWALGSYSHWPSARRSLEASLTQEHDPSVVQAIQASLAE